MISRRGLPQRMPVQASARTAARQHATQAMRLRNRSPSSEASFEKVSDCLAGQAVCHGIPSLRMALRIVISFRAVAIRATSLGLPAAMSRSRKVFSAAL